MDITLVSIIVTAALFVIGIGYAIRVAKKQQRVAREQQKRLEQLESILSSNRQRLGWRDIHEAARRLASRLRKFNPDCILAGNGSPLLVAAMVVEELYWWLPVYVIYTDYQKVGRVPNNIPKDKYASIRLPQRNHYVDRSFLGHGHRRIAIIDDTAFDTIYYHALIEWLIRDGGLSRENLFVATVVASRRALESKVVDWAYESVTHLDVLVPWGRERGFDHRNARSASRS